MGFNAAKAAVVRALRDGDFQHEWRDAEKNLLAIGDIEAHEVARLVLRTHSGEYAESPHHWDRSVTVHTFKPLSDGVRWYIKAYFIEQAEDTAVFISVHPAEK